MFARIVMLMLIAVLALPVATLTRPAQTSPSSWSDVAVAKKGKKHKHKKHKKRNHRTRTIRREVTRTFTSTQAITIPNGAPASDEGPASPYPSAMAVSGFRHGRITDVNLILTDLTHTTPRDVDLLLSTSDGRRALVLSDVGDDVVDAVVNVDLTLDDQAAAPLPAKSRFESGVFQPFNHEQAGDDDLFAPPAPAHNGNVLLSTFDGADPNGTWRLWVMDNAAFSYGDLGGWALEITAEVDVKVRHQ